jgi:hypothetical protein
LNRAIQTSKKRRRRTRSARCADELARGAGAGPPVSSRSVKQHQKPEPTTLLAFSGGAEQSPAAPKGSKARQIRQPTGVLTMGWRNFG